MDDTQNVYLDELAKALNAATSHNVLWVYTVGLNTNIVKIIYSVSGNSGQLSIITNAYL